MELFSAYKRAEIIIKQHEKTSKDVRDEDEEDDGEQQVTYDLHSTSTYQNIVKYIVAFQRLRGSQCIHMNDFIGYQVINMRSSPISLASPGNINHERKQVVSLIKIANREFHEITRPSISSSNAKQNLQSTQTEENNESQLLPTTLTYHDNNVEVEDVQIEYDEEWSTAIEEQDKENKNNISRYKRRFTCCACCVTSTTDNTTTFSRVPGLPGEDIRPWASDEIRQPYYKNKFHRRLFLQRFGLNQKDQRPELRFCGHHPLEIATKEYVWINQQGKKLVQLQNLNYQSMKRNHQAEQDYNNKYGNHCNLFNHQYMVQILETFKLKQ
jgi:hypothetical protein